MLIFVSGPPGAGKTTLATAIAEQLHLPHVNRDRIYEGLRHAAADPSLPVVPAGIHAFRVVLENLLREGVSVVADATLYAGTSEPDINCLLEISDALNLHCEAPAALARFGARLETDPRRHGYNLDALIEVARNNLRYTQPPLDVGWETVRVDTSDGYEPELTDLVARCRPLPRDLVPLTEAPPAASASS